jgi:hypothetical protein
MGHHGNGPKLPILQNISIWHSSFSNSPDNVTSEKYSYSLFYRGEGFGHQNRSRPLHYTYICVYILWGLRSMRVRLPVPVVCRVSSCIIPNHVQEMYTGVSRNLYNIKYIPTTAFLQTRTCIQNNMTYIRRHKKEAECHVCVLFTSVLFLNTSNWFFELLACVFLCMGMGERVCCQSNIKSSIYGDLYV